MWRWPHAEGSWAAAWRDDANGMETITVQAGSSKWTVGPAFLPGPDGAKPALAELDATHLLVVYAVGADNTDSGVANDSLLEAAVVDTAAAPGPVAAFPRPRSRGERAGPRPERAHLGERAR